MNASVISFVFWCLIMVVMIVAMLIAAKRSRHRDNEIEDVASEALPQIGKAAASCHQRTFGKRPDTIEDGPWYPEVHHKKKSSQHA